MIGQRKSAIANKMATKAIQFTVRPNGATISCPSREKTYEPGESTGGVARAQTRPDRAAHVCSLHGALSDSKAALRAQSKIRSRGGRACWTRLVWGLRGPRCGHMVYVGDASSRTSLSTVVSNGVDQAVHRLESGVAGNDPARGFLVRRVPAVVGDVPG